MDFQNLKKEVKEYQTDRFDGPYKFIYLDMRLFHNRSDYFGRIREKHAGYLYFARTKKEDKISPKTIVKCKRELARRLDEAFLIEDTLYFAEVIGREDPDIDDYYMRYGYIPRRNSKGKIIGPRIIDLDATPQVPFPMNQRLKKGKRKESLLL
jgi:hypothetical protein